MDVAIARKSNVSSLPDLLEVNLYYYSDKRFELGIETVANGKNHFRIYDIEKTVVDIVFYREEGWCRGNKRDSYQLSKEKR